MVVLEVGKWLLMGGAGCLVLASRGLVRSSVEVGTMGLDILRVKGPEVVMEHNRSLFVVEEAARLLDRHSCPGHICSWKHLRPVLDMPLDAVVDTLLDCRKPFCVISARKFRKSVVRDFSRKA